MLNFTIICLTNNNTNRNIICLHFRSVICHHHQSSVGELDKTVQLSLTLYCRVRFTLKIAKSIKMNILVDINERDTVTLEFMFGELKLNKKASNFLLQFHYSHTFCSFHILRIFSSRDSTISL